MPAGPTSSRDEFCPPHGAVAAEAPRPRRLMHLGHGPDVVHFDRESFPDNPAGSMFVDAGNVKAAFTDAGTCVTGWGRRRPTRRRQAGRRQVRRRRHGR